MCEGIQRDLRTASMTRVKRIVGMTKDNQVDMNECLEFRQEEQSIRINDVEKIPLMNWSHSIVRV